MLEILQAKSGSTIVMDAGFATEENINWLKDNNYEYIVVSRKRKNPDNLDDINEVIVKEERNNLVTAKLIKNEETNELELYCHSEAKEAKSKVMENKFTRRFEDELQKLQNGLTKTRAIKSYQKISEKIGRLKERYSRVSQLYEISLITQVKKDKRFSKNNGDNKDINIKNLAVKNISWKKIPNKNTKSGTYCLRTNKTDLDAKQFWKTYTMLTELEEAFRHLKSELGLRPIYHHKEERVDGHIFITILAYHLLHTVRYQLKQKNINHSWKAIRDIMSAQYRLTSTMELEDNRTVNIRKTSKANADQMIIYNALNINSNPGITIKKYF
jgi:transposase